MDKSQKHNIEQKEQVAEDFMQYDAMYIKFESRERKMDFQVKLNFSKLNTWVYFLFKHNANDSKGIYF